MVARNARAQVHRGFTLVELLIVITIILLVSAVALPTVLPALNNRQMSEAARLLQGALAGARDQAIHDGQPCGIRLLPDPAFPVTYNAAGNQINPFAILAYNRVVPINAAPDYSEGLVTVRTATPAAYYVGSILNPTGANAAVPSLILEQSPVDRNGLVAAPTSWAWNVRVGDRIQINDAGPWYTVVGPMWTGPAYGNSELFVNWGNAGPSPLTNPAGAAVEWLVLTNGRDDGGPVGYPAITGPDGWVDSGWDGVDNDGVNGPDDANEWEVETWAGPVSSLVAVPYTIRRRPAPAAAARELALPSRVVIDGTSLLNTRERSRLPVNDPLTQLTGAVDVVLNPDGTVLPTPAYGAPSSFGMDQAFYHFWLADRQDLADQQAGASGPVPIAQAGYTLPIAQPGTAAPALNGPYLKSNYAVVTLSARTGTVATTENPPFLFDNALGYNSQGGAWNATFPFIPAEMGAR